MEIISVEQSSNLLVRQPQVEPLVLEKPVTVTVENTESQTVVVKELDVLVKQDEVREYVVQGGIQGPAGIAGPAGPAGPVGPSGPPGEEEMVYSKRVDFVGEQVIYRAEALVGSSDSTALWRIRKITLSADGDVAETWANGTAEFDKIWNQRTSYTYS